MDNLQNFNSFNEGLKDKIKNRWEKFKDELHPWDFTRDEWKAKWGNKPKDTTEKNIDPFGEENWSDNNIPENPYTATEFNYMIRNKEIRKCDSNVADFLWNYKNGKSVYFKKL